MSDKVPTYEELRLALKVPEIEYSFDSMGRVVRKKNPKKIKAPSQKRKGLSKYDRN